MAEKITQAQMKEMAKANIAQVFAEAIESHNGEKVDSYTYAIPTEVNGQEIWVEVKFTSKNWYKTTRSEAYDPFEVQSAYNEKIRQREADKAERERKKAEKIAKSKKKVEE